MKPVRDIQASLGDMFTRFEQAPEKPKLAVVKSTTNPPRARQQPVQRYSGVVKPQVHDMDVEHLKKSQRVKALMLAGKTYRQALELVFPEQFEGE